MKEFETTFPASISGLKTCADGGYKLTLDIPASEAEAFKALIDLNGCLLQVGIVASG